MSLPQFFAVPTTRVRFLFVLFLVVMLLLGHSSRQTQQSVRALVLLHRVLVWRHTAWKPKVLQTNKTD